MVRKEIFEDMIPKQVRLYANEGNFDRQLVFAYCYPDYDDQIRIKLNSVGLGFQLSKEVAENLRDVLNSALEEMK